MQDAQAALREANENYYAQRGSLLPAVQASYAFERQRNATGTLSPTLTSGESVFNLHTAQVSVSYVLDVFGGVRRQEEAGKLTYIGQYHLSPDYKYVSADGYVYVVDPHTYAVTQVIAPSL